MSEHESSHKHGDPSSEPGGADEVAASHPSVGGAAAATGTGTEPSGDVGVGLGVGEPSTFEPEEDPSTVPDDPA